MTLGRPSCLMIMVFNIAVSLLIYYLRKNYLNQLMPSIYEEYGVKLYSIEK